MRHTFIIIGCICALLLTACGSNDSFTISGQIENLGMRSVEMYYYASGSMKYESVAAQEDKFQFKGTSKTPTLATIALPDHTVIATLIVENGDEIRLKGSIDDPYSIEIKGSKPSKRMADFMADNLAATQSGDTEAMNKAIAGYVAEHKNDIVSTALLVTAFNARGNESLADSLLSLIDQKARPQSVLCNFAAVLSSQLSTSISSDIVPMSLYDRKDTVVRYNPVLHSYSMLAFVGPTSSQRDSIVPKLREITDSLPAKRFKVVEISMAVDSTAWKRSVASDSAEWIQAWAPGSVASNRIKRLSVPFVPYFIVVDSAGSQLMRTPSINEALSLVYQKTRMDKNKKH